MCYLLLSCTVKIASAVLTSECWNTESQTASTLWHSTGVRVRAKSIRVVRISPVASVIWPAPFRQRHPLPPTTITIVGLMSVDSPSGTARALNKLCVLNVRALLRRLPPTSAQASADGLFAVINLLTKLRPVAAGCCTDWSTFSEFALRCIRFSLLRLYNTLITNLEKPHICVHVETPARIQLISNFHVVFVCVNNNLFRLPSRA